MTKLQKLERDIGTMVRGGYDLQKLRIQMGNRIVAQFKAKLGIKPGKKEDDADANEMDAAGENILRELRANYAKLMDGVATFPSPSQFEGEGLLSTFAELCLVSQYRSLEVNEKEAFHRLGKVIEDVPLWKKFLKDVRGCGPAMAGVLISEIDISQARYASSLWKYAGLDVAGDGRGRGRWKGHQIDVTYKSREGDERTRKSLTFNPFLKTKLIGVLGPSFIKQVRGGEPAFYRQIYLDYKHRMENHVVYGVANEKAKNEDGRFITSKGRRHNMAVRYMVKIFLKDLYAAWRPLEKLSVALPYSEVKLGLAKHHTPTEGA